MKSIFLAMSFLLSTQPVFAAKIEVDEDIIKILKIGFRFAYYVDKRTKLCFASKVHSDGDGGLTAIPCEPLILAYPEVAKALK